MSHATPEPSPASADAATASDSIGGLVDPSAPAIAYGDHGDAVHEVQRRLSSLGYDDSGVDGVFGDSTFEAVRRFQRARGITADGLVGPVTWRELVEASWTLGDRLLWQSRSMLRGDDVRELQTRLNQLGFDAGAEDGIFGPLAHAATTDFQRNVGLAADGVVGLQTVEALRRLQRGHQAGGLGIMARERESVRRLSQRGLVGAHILLDPRGGGEHQRPERAGVSEAEVCWQLGARITGRLDATGAVAALSRGPHTNPTPSARAALANDLGVDVVLSLGCNSHHSPAAHGAASYYFGGPQFTSEAGRTLADLMQRHVVAAGWGPDCRAHPRTWSILRETRMPTVVVEPAFLTNPASAARLADPAELDTLAAALVGGLTAFLGGPVARNRLSTSPTATAPLPGG